MLNKLVDFGIVTIVPFKETFYKKFETPKKLKLTPKLLELNYARYAPFLKPKILHYNDQKSIHLWFHKQQDSASFAIAESYLIFRVMKEHFSNAVVAVESDVIKVFVIKDGALTDLFNMSSFDEQTLALCKHEHNIQNHRIVHKEEYETLYKEAINDFPLHEIWHWRQFELDAKNILHVSVNAMSYPVSILLILAMGMNIVHTQILQTQLSEAEQNYLHLKEQNSDIHAQVAQSKKLQKKWHAFTQNELLYPDTMIVLSEIFKTLNLESKNQIKLVEIVGSKITIQYQSDQSPVLFLNHLNSIALFSEVTIVNTIKRRRKTNIIVYSVQLKPLKEHS